MRVAVRSGEGTRPRNGDDVLWNWARWCWSGETVGNMARYMPWEDTFQPILVEEAQVVERMHQELPHHEGMIITAEFPQRNVRFEGLPAPERRAAAIRWIRGVTGVQLSTPQYQLYLGLFRRHVERGML